MELSKKHIEKLVSELDLRYEKLIEELKGVDFTTKDKTPWLHCMDERRRECNSYIDAMNLRLSLADFNTILTEIKRLKS